MTISFVVNGMKMAVFGIISRIAQLLVDLIFGPSSSDKKANGILCYDVLYDWKFFALQGGDPSLFTLKFTRVRDLSWIEREDVTLYTVSEEEFVFVRTNPDVDIHDAEQHPFLYVVKHDSTQELGRVAREVVVDYLRGSGKMDRDGSNIAILHNIGRCGSTLVTSMVSKTKQCHVLSEPIALMDVVNILTRKERPITRDTEEYYDLVKETLVLLTPDPNRKYFIKTHSQIIYSSTRSSSVAGDKGIIHAPSFETHHDFNASSIFWHRPVWLMETFFIHQMPKNVQKLWEENKVREFGEITIIMTLANFYVYLNETEDRSDIKSFTYESLIADKSSFCKSIFQEFGIDEQYVELALTAMDKDSQKNSVISKDKTGANKVEVSDEALEWGKRIGGQMGIEMEGHDYRISNIKHAWDYRS